jgi:TPR repeat protein
MSLKNKARWVVVGALAGSWACAPEFIPDVPSATPVRAIASTPAPSASGPAPINSTTSNEADYSCEGLKAHACGQMPLDSLLPCMRRHVCTESIMNHLSVDEIKYRRECDAGSPASCVELGRRLELLLGLQGNCFAQRDLELDREFARVSRQACRSSLAACDLLGWSLLRGLGVTTDAPAGRANYQIACSSGNYHACLVFAAVWQEVWQPKHIVIPPAGGSAPQTLKDAPTEPGWDAAYRYIITVPKRLERACARADASACTMRGELYQNPRTFESELSTEKALVYLRKGCALGDVGGCARGATLLLSASTTDPTVISDVAKLYDRACSLSPHGCEGKAALLGCGCGVPRDETRSLELFRSLYCDL